MELTHFLTENAAKMESSIVREFLRYSQQPNIISLAGGLPDEALMPAYPDVRLLQDTRQYGTSDGEPSLKNYIETLVASRGLVGDIKSMVTNGSQQALDIVSRLLLDGAATILTEQPTYLAACQVFKLQGANVQGVVSDEQGMSIQTLESLIDRHHPKAVYLIPNFQNPTGHCYSVNRRKEIASLLDRKNVLLIEDDPYGELCYEDLSLPPIASFMKQSPWVYLGSFSKVLWPGLRVGYVATGAELMPYLEKIKQTTDLHSNRLGQLMVEAFMASGQFPDHIASLKKTYKKKRDVMAGALDKYLGESVSYSLPAGGMFFWVMLPAGVSSMAVLEACLKENVLVLPGKAFFPAPCLVDDRYLRLSFARGSVEEIHHAIQVLSTVVKHLIPDVA